jgi:uncharacterized protein (TIGR02266 family)
MAQDTRKDPRAKVLTMTVRYKSATLDEFIENHSHDVSRGGMFIKTPSPFPPGTLLKFEVRIAGEQRLIQGVGRVVWRRDTSDSASERPAGMGIKFIKLDDKSKQVIESLVEKRRDEESTFELGAKGSAGAAVSRPPERAVAEDAPTQMLFPEGPSNMPPPEDRTMVKQAAELLQEALREAGGSIQDVEEAPAPKQPPKPPPALRVPEQKAAVVATPATAPAAKDKAQPAPPPAPAERRMQRPEEVGSVATPARVALPEDRGGGGGRAVAIVLALGVAAAVVYFFAQRKPSAPPSVERAQPSAKRQVPEPAKPEPPPPAQAAEPPSTVAAADAARVVDAGKPDAAAEVKPAVAKAEPAPEVKPEKPAVTKPAPVVPKVALRVPKPKPQAGTDAGATEAPKPPPAAEPPPEAAPAPAPTPPPELPAAGPEPKSQPAPSAPAETNPY